MGLIPRHKKYLSDKEVIKRARAAAWRNESVGVGPAGAAWLAEDTEVLEHGYTERQMELMRVAYDFRRFLDYWYFTPEGGSKTLLGKSIWPGQETYAHEAMIHKWIYYLKARQLGESTIACAYDAWRLRFGPPNSRVHIMSRTESEAIGLLADVVFGLDRLPAWMQLDSLKRSDKEITFGVKDDKRIAHAYATSSSPGRGETCTHAHIDELAFMENPAKVWAAIEPGISMNGTCHIVTTNDAPESFTAILWRKCIVGDGQFFACFVDALQRPDRNAAWYRAKRAATPDEAHFLREYPMKWEDALRAGGKLWFTSAEIDAAGTDYRGFGRWRSGRKYVIGVDVGQKDATVITVLDFTEEVHDVVGWLRLVGASYPIIQGKIKEAHVAYPSALIVIEKNGPGMAMAENLDIPEHMIEMWWSSKPSKAGMIEGLKMQFQGWLLKYNPAECPALDAELRGYMIPDENITQDCVMSLGIAELYTSKISAGQGRMVAVMQV